MAAVPMNKLCRRNGWRKFLYTESPYQNHDLHDQLLSKLTYYDEATPVDANSDEVQSYPSSQCGTTLNTRTRPAFASFCEDAAVSAITRLLLAMVIWASLIVLVLQIDGPRITTQK